MTVSLTACQPVQLSSSVCASLCIFPGTFPLLGWVFPVLRLCHPQEWSVPHLEECKEREKPYAAIVKGVFSCSS